jgi:hypothetical protein
MTGPERTFANSYRPDEDIIRYNQRQRKVYKVKAGDYARVIDTDHEKNRITVRFLMAASSLITRRGFPV